MLQDETVYCVYCVYVKTALLEILGKEDVKI